jgi:signal transduction histidine kinase
MNTIKARRRQYLVNRPVQFRYMGLVGIPLMILLAGLYYLIYYAVFNEMLIPEAVTATLLPAMKKVNLIAAVALPFIFFIILKRALVYSNRIIGPIPRLERELDKVIGGDYSVRIRTRDTDELNGFITKVNLILERLSEASGRN